MIFLHFSHSIQNANSDSSFGVLPVDKGGTGVNLFKDFKTNLGFTASLSASSTNEQFPDSKSVYTYQQPIEKGIIETVYFNLTYEKYANKDVLMYISTKQPKKAITQSTELESLGTLPTSIRPKGTLALFPFVVFNNDSVVYDQYFLFLSHAAGGIGFPAHKAAQSSQFVGNYSLLYKARE
jgi:hypothetical protein